MFDNEDDEDEIVDRNISNKSEVIIVEHDGEDFILADKNDLLTLVATLDEDMSITVTKKMLTSKQREKYDELEV